MRYSIIILLLFCASCRWYKKNDQNFTIKKVTNTDSKPRLDGYYYKFDDSGNVVSVFFFFKDGIVMTPEAFLGGLEGAEREFSNPVLLEKVYGYAEHWGLYKVEGDSIVFELKRSGAGPLQLFRSVGFFNTDSSFAVSRVIYNGQSEDFENPRIYYFRKYKPKLDSANQFIN
jgi:hypothetical protein